MTLRLHCLGSNPWEKYDIYLCDGKKKDQVPDLQAAYLLASATSRLYLKREAANLNLMVVSPSSKIYTYTD